MREFCFLLHSLRLLTRSPAFSLGGEKASAKRDLEGGTPHKIDLLRKQFLFGYCLLGRLWVKSLAPIAHTVARRIKAGLRGVSGSIASPRQSGDYLGGGPALRILLGGYRLFFWSLVTKASLSREVDRRRRDGRRALLRCAVLYHFGWPDVTFGTA